jgi:hypothetical protein
VTTVTSHNWLPPLAWSLLDAERRHQLIMEQVCESCSARPGNPCTGPSGGQVPIAHFDRLYSAVWYFKQASSA